MVFTGHPKLKLAIIVLIGIAFGGLPNRPINCATSSARNVVWTDDREPNDLGQLTRKAVGGAQSAIQMNAFRAFIMEHVGFAGIAMGCDYSCAQDVTEYAWFALQGEKALIFAET